RTPGMLFQKQPDGRISNLYNYKIVNKTTKDFPLSFKLEGIEGEIKLVGTTDLTAKNQNISEGEFFVIVNEDQIPKRKTKIKIGVYSGDEKIETVKTNFMGPSGKHMIDKNHQEHED
nr:FixG Ig-like domain-containing protein [Bacteroidia bacterium]